jgi:hypothetical protein
MDTNEWEEWRHGHGAWTRRGLNTHYWNAEMTRKWTSRMDIQNGSAAWECSVEMQHGPAAWICSIDMLRKMQHGDMEMQHRHEHGHTVWTWIYSMNTDMQHGHGHAA